MKTLSLYLMVVGCVALFLDDKALYVLLYGLAGLVFLASFAYKAVAARVTVSLEVGSDRINYGEGTELLVWVSNPTKLPIPVLGIRSFLPQAMLQVPPVFVASLPPGGTIRVSYPIMGARRGVYPVRDMEVVLGDGVTEKTWKAPIPTVAPEITVYPRIWPISALRLPSRNPYGQVRSSIRFFEDASRVIGVRDYEPGDSPRRINWRATARVGELQVKEFQPTISLDSVILLDLDPRDYPQSSPEDFGGMAIEAASSFAYHLLEAGQTVGFITNVGRGGDGEPCELVIRQGKGNAQLTRVMDLLARIEIREGVDFSKTVHAGRMGAQPGSTIIIILPGGRADTFDSSLILQRAGYKVLLVVVGGTDTPQTLTALTARGVKVWQIFSAYDLQRLAV